MGWRRLRVGLDRPAILRRQLRALLLAAAGRPLSIMFPMVATVEEFRAARACWRPRRRGFARRPERLEVGTMIEVPSLMFQLPGLLAEADFVSVGTNDLMQFLFAADRGTPELADRYDMLSPPVLELLEQLGARPARRRGVPLSVCGEAAARPLEALAFAAMGVTTLSMSGDGHPAGEGAAGGGGSGGVAPGACSDPSRRGRRGEPAGADRDLGTRATGLDV